MDDKKRECSSLMDGLERLADMYKDGLLSDDEFVAIKKKPIEENEDAEMSELL